MIYKIMFWLGLALAAVLIIENMAASTGFAYIAWVTSSVWQAMFVALIVGIIIGIGLPKAFNTDNKNSVENEDLYFN